MSRDASSEPRTLPAESVPAHDARTVARTLFFALALFAASNVVMRAVLDRGTPNVGYAIIRAKWQRLEALEETPDVVLVGDSSCLHGLDATQMSRALGQSVLNLCTVGSMGVSGSTAMVRRLVERGRTPSTVLVVHVYDAWYREPSGYVVAQSGLSFAETERTFGFAPSTFDRTAQLEWALDRYVPVFAEGDSVSELGRRLVGRAGPPFEGFDASGFLPLAPADEVTMRRDVASHLEFLAGAEPSIAVASRDALVELVALGRREHLEVVLVEAPIVETIAREESFQRYQRALRTLVDAATRDGGGPLRRVEARVFPPSQMANADHLIASAAGEWTEVVSRALDSP